MQLPQEINDLIIDHFCKDKPTLSRCALVSRAWVDRSQAHLFNFVLLEGNSLRLWVDKFSPSDGRIHSFVKNLVLFPPSNSFGYFREHALAFKRLEALTINGERIPRGFQLFPCTNWFSHLRDTLEYLQLEDVVFSPRIVAGFPRLGCLVVRYSALRRMDDTNEGDNTPAEADPHATFKGILEFSTLPNNSEITLLEAFLDYPLGYNDIRVGVTTYPGHSPGESINRLISRCSNTLEWLEIDFQDEKFCKSDSNQP